MPECQFQPSGALERTGARDRSAVTVGGQSRFRSPRTAACAAAASAWRTMSSGMRCCRSDSCLGLLCDASRVSASQSSRMLLVGRATPPRRTRGASFAAFLMRTSFAAAAALPVRRFLVPCSRSAVTRCVSEDCYRVASCGCSLGTRGCSVPPVSPRLLRPVRAYPAPPGFRRGRCGMAPVP